MEPHAYPPARGVGEPMSITAQEFEDIHSGYGEDISVSDGDGRIYHQETCRCGIPLGMHLSLEAHQAQELERYVQERITESAENNHTPRS